MLDNRSIADLLRRVAAVFEVTDTEIFRCRAYENTAAAIEGLDIPLKNLWEKNRLDEIPGLGPNLISHLDELFKTGKVKHFELELKKVPAGMFPLLQIRGIGPKLAYRISTKFALNDPDLALKQLKELIDKNQLLGLDGFAASLQEKIKKSLEQVSTQSSRLLLSQALSISEDYLIYLRRSPLVNNAMPLGSLRRKVATVGDIDLGISSSQPAKALKHALAYPQIKTVISAGESVIRVQLESGYSIDVKSVLTSDWGSLLQHYTGSKLHNIALRNLAKSKKLSLSEYGIKNSTGKTYHFSDENSFYAHLGLAYIPPELREDQGEIGTALKNQLPRLVELLDIKGDLHLHSDFQYPSSHDIGESPLKDYLIKAYEKKYQYLGFADHNPKFSELSREQRKKILEKRKNYLITQYLACENDVKISSIKLLIGLEIDIRRNGDLALEPDLIDLLDYAIISVHNSFDLTEAENTKRLLKALASHPKIKILAHPTTRILNGRQPIQADWEKIFNYCAQNQIFLEINAFPSRLDLPDDLIREAIRLKAQLIINTDSHIASQLDNLCYGVWTARRGWAEKKHLLNTLNFKDLQSVLNCNY